MGTRIPLPTVAIRRDQDILLARQSGRQICQHIGFSTSDTTRVTTALSEVARNALEYAAGGLVDFAIESSTPELRELVIRVVDRGVGIGDIDAVLAPTFKSRTGLGVGLKGSRSLMDRFEITSTIGSGTTVVMGKALPRSAPPFGAAEAARLSQLLAKTGSATPFAELQLQNQALLATLEELTQRQAEIERLGVIADDARGRAEAAQAVAERSLVVRDRFMALTTHELRTPLGAIVGYLELLDMELASSLTGRPKDYFARTQEACRHLLGVTNDFLDMAQGDAGRLRVARHAGSARHVIGEASSLIAPQAAARDVMVRFREEPEEIVYLGDTDRVRQVLINILGNAVSFTPQGGTVDIIATRATSAPPGTALTNGPWCVIRVEDTGPGIPDDRLAHVFEPFVQLSQDGRSRRGGSGLGLTVSRQLALLMGGDLTATSSARGAAFSLWLPAHSA